MLSPLAKTTLQATACAILSSILAQIIQTNQIPTLSNIDTTAIARFATFSLITTPPNIKWQEYLEHSYPGTQPTTSSDGTQKTNKPNTIKKIVLDQTLGAAVNSAAFIAFFSAVSGAGLLAVFEAVRDETVGLMVAGWKLWPLVSVLNFTVVPLEYRVLVSSGVGLFWGVYLSLLASGKV